MKTFRSAYCLVLFTALVACSGKDPQTHQTQSSTRSNIALMRRLAEIAGQANQAAPAEVDANTRLDGAKAGPGLKLTSMYTLINPESEGIDTTTFGTKLTPVVQKGSCTNPDLRPLIDQGVVVVLEYRRTDGNLMGTVSIDRNTCVGLK